MIRCAELTEYYDFLHGRDVYMLLTCVATTATNIFYFVALLLGYMVFVPRVP